MPAWRGYPTLRGVDCGVRSPDGRFRCDRGADHVGQWHWQLVDLESDEWAEWWSDEVSPRKPLDVPL